MNPVLKLFPITAEVKEGVLYIGGCSLTSLANEFGTPLYIFDEQTIRDRCAQIKREFSSRYQHPTLTLYAGKAFLCKALLRIICDEGLGLDVVSGGEISLARAVSFPMERVYFNGSNKLADELELALELGVGRIVVDNLYELSLLEGIAKRRGKKVAILLRINPGVDPHKLSSTHRYTVTGVVDSKFGIPSTYIEEAVRQALSSPFFELKGLHFHIGSGIYHVEPYRGAIASALKLANQLKRKFGFLLEELDIGGGFAVDYTLDNPAPPISEYAGGIISAIFENLDDLPPPLLILEPGRWIVGMAGVALYRVGSIKQIPGIRTYVSVDGGIGDNIRPALYGSKYQAIVANKAEHHPKERVTIAGKYCQSGDILIRDIELPPLSAGDLIAIPVCGAYCLSMASNYNMNPRPAVVGVYGGRARLWRRRETYSDLWAHDEE